MISVSVFWAVIIQILYFDSKDSAWIQLQGKVRINSGTSVTWEFAPVGVRPCSSLQKNCLNFSVHFFHTWSSPFCSHFVLLGIKKITRWCPVIIATFIGLQDKIWCAIKHQNYYRRMSFNLLRRPQAVKIWSLWPLSYFTSPHCSLCFMFGPPLNYFLPL